jgi:hypothetical protein
MMNVSRPLARTSRCAGTIRGVSLAVADGAISTAVSEGVPYLKAHGEPPQMHIERRVLLGETQVERWNDHLINSANLHQRIDKIGRGERI